MWRASIVVGVVVLVLVGCGGGGEGAGTSAPETPATSAAGPLAEYRGEPLVANVWASW